MKRGLPYTFCKIIYSDMDSNMLMNTIKMKILSIYDIKYKKVFLVSILKISLWHHNINKYRKIFR